MVDSNWPIYIQYIFIDPVPTQPCFAGITFVAKYNSPIVVLRLLMKNDRVQWQLRIGDIQMRKGTHSFQLNNANSSHNNTWSTRNLSEIINLNKFHRLLTGNIILRSHRYHVMLHHSPISSILCYVDAKIKA